jgi:hypothetical protein
MVKGVLSNGVEFVSSGFFEYSSNDAWCEGIKMWKTIDNTSQGTCRAWRPSQWTLLSKVHYKNSRLIFIIWFPTLLTWSTFLEMV